MQNDDSAVRGLIETVAVAGDILIDDREDPSIHLARVVWPTGLSRSLCRWGTKAPGAIAGGVLAELLTIRTVFVVMGALSPMLLAGLTRLSGDAMDAAERARTNTD